MYGRHYKNKHPLNDETYTKPLKNFSVQDLLKGKNLELIAAALLLTGKLKVDSVEVFRMSPTINVTLIGKYASNNNDKSNALANFLEKMEI